MKTIQEIKALLTEARANSDNLTPFNAGPTVKSIVATLDAVLDEMESFGQSPEGQALAKVLQVPGGTALLPPPPGLTPNPNSPNTPPDTTGINPVPPISTVSDSNTPPPAD